MKRLVEQINLCLKAPFDVASSFVSLSPSVLLPTRLNLSAAFPFVFKSKILNIAQSVTTIDKFFILENI